MTTNCIQRPKETYQGRIFTTGLVAWPSVNHIGDDKDFGPVIEAAKAGSHVATIPPAILDKMLAHPLTDDGLEKFAKDWATVKS